MLYPDQAFADEKTLAKLIATYTGAYESIVGEIAGATDWGVQNRKMLLAQIDEILAELNQQTQPWIDTTITKQYTIGANQAVAQLKNVGADVRVAGGFNKIHKAAIAALIDETSKAFGEGLTGLSRSGQLLLGRINRELITQKLAEGIIKGQAIREARQQIKGIILEQGMGALIDRSGRSWTLDRYADMLFRTKLVEARNRGLVNRLVENEYDLVQVSAHFDACPLCDIWQGKILSTTGASRGYPTLGEAEAAGLFHPNCRHAINVLSPKLANMTRAYDPATGALSKAGATIKKPITDAAKKHIIDPAIAYQAKFEKMVDQVGQSGNWKIHMGPVKTLDRSVEKIINDYNGDVYRLKDANRATLVIKNPYDKAEFEAMQKAVGKLFGDYDTKNRLDVTDGYASAIINPVIGGRKLEIQVSYAEMLRAKNELGGHDLYEIVRIKKAGWEKAEREMLALYADALKLMHQRLGIGLP